MSIVEGLKHAISRGATLQQAMMSFYNAGYTKEEIEESARIIQTKNYDEHDNSKKIVSVKKTKKVSDYEQQPKRKLILILKISLLATILALLVFAFLFGEDIINLFSS